MAIIQNVACTGCQNTGHDHRGTNMIVFDNGAKYCNRSHWHKDGLPLYIPADGSDPITSMEVTGTIKYTPEQFKKLAKDGKLNNPNVREIALRGMRGQDRWEVSSAEEQAIMIQDRKEDEAYFNGLSVRNLVDRHIPGQIAKFYNVRVGLNTEGKTARHYYPCYDSEGNWKGAKCRTLPKDFKYDHLGWMWGDGMMFGQKQTAEVIASGARMDTLVLVGGECDAMAAQTMLLEGRAGTKWANTKFHVWSVMKGEASLSEILHNKEEIKKFKKILVCFDNDATGNKLNKSVGKIFRGKAFKLALPDGCKDPNDALKQGRGKEFVDAWWNPVDIFEGGSLSSASKYRDKAKVMPTMGMSWPWPSLDPVTYGIRKNYLGVWGAGTGVGKTKTTKEVVFHLAYEHAQPVVVIYLEEPAHSTVRSFAGNLINKDLNAPPCNDKEDPDYNESRDYTEAEANKAIDQLCDDGLIMIGDLEGRKDVASVMEVLEEALAMGYEYFVIDNLTAFEHSGAEGKKVNSVDAIDETMKRLGTFKDEHPVHLMLLSHLKKVYGERTPHEEGGRVSIGDFRGAGSITFWADGVFGIERNTGAESFAEKCLTTYHCLKNRTVGHKVGSKVYAMMNLKTGRLLETSAPPEKKKFDDGTGPKKINKTTDEKDF